MDDRTADLEKWRAQMRKGFLELCVLALLEAKGEAYGLDLMETLGKAGVEVGEGTLYPLLARMTREGSLAAEWETPDKGHPRKYYRLTDQGGLALEAMRGEYEADYRAYRDLGSLRRGSGRDADRGGEA
jgi:PadR family transcriptional regulator, regulatory protein PadR